MSNKANKAALLALAFLCCAAAFAEEGENEIRLNSADFPKIQSLYSANATKEARAEFYRFNKEYQKQLERASRDAAHPDPKNPFAPQFYTYKVSGEKNLSGYWELEGRCALAKGALASINGIENVEERLLGRTLIIPASWGIFISPKATSNIGIILFKKYSHLIEENGLPCYNIDGVPFYYIAGRAFGMEEMSLFLDPGMVMPLERSVLTSSYGMRISPVYGTWKMHGGVDLAAPTGTPVHSCKKGTVAEATANHPVYGNVIVLRHDEGLSSTYAHLSKMMVARGQAVSSGQTIGLVGTTGLSTGPHLHFEIRRDGKTQDPAAFLKIR